MGERVSCCEAIEQQKANELVVYGKEETINLNQQYKYRSGEPSSKVAINIYKLRQFAKTIKDWQQLQDNLFELIGNQKKKKRKKIDVNRVQIGTNKLQDPYFIPNQNAFYLGQWAYDESIQDNIPYGIGKLYEKDVISEGVFKTFKLSSQEKEGELSMVKEKKQVEQQEKNNEGSKDQQISQNKIDVLINGQKQNSSYSDDEIKNIVVKLDGQGIIYSKQIQMYGSFYEGLLHGKATLKMPKDQYQYVGTWKNGNKHGKGKEKSKETSYEGYFKNNLRDGRGIQVFYGTMKKVHAREADEEKFKKKISEEGDEIKKQEEEKIKTRKNQQKKIKKSLIKFPYPLDLNFKSMLFDLNIAIERQHKTVFLQEYSGQFQKNKMHGKGKYTWANKKIYEGHWKQGVMEGQGQFYWPDGSLYQGAYKNDLRHGKGLMIWNVLQRYRGDWAFGLRHGYGEAIQIDEKWNIVIKGGIWNQDKLVQLKFKKIVQVEQ